MTVQQINVSPKGGVPKTRVLQARITFAGVEGDKQRDRRFHGGPMRAVSLFSSELIEELQRAGHSIAPGTTGENLTLQGMDWPALRPGIELRIGECDLEITSYVVPCKKIAASFADGNFKRLSQKLYPGNSRVYARVLREGTVCEGDAVHLAATPEFDRTPSL